MLVIVYRSRNLILISAMNCIPRMRRLNEQSRSEQIPLGKGRGEGQRRLFNTDLCRRCGDARQGKEGARPSRTPCSARKPHPGRMGELNSPGGEWHIPGRAFPPCARSFPTDLPYTGNTFWHRHQHRLMEGPQEIGTQDETLLTPSPAQPS